MLQRVFQVNFFLELNLCICVRNYFVFFGDLPLLDNATTINFEDHRKIMWEDFQN